MAEQTSSIISKVWGMCGPLRDDGVSYRDYLEHLTYLIFLKMSDEYANYGNELVASTFKLCLMNLYLHNIGDVYGSVPVVHGDSLLTDPGYRVDYVLTNLHFDTGRKGTDRNGGSGGERQPGLRTSGHRVQMCRPDRSSRGKLHPPLTPPYVPFGIRRFNSISKHVFQDNNPRD